MAWNWNPIASLFIRLDRSFVIKRVDGIEISQSDIAVQALIPFEQFATVSRHTAHDRGHGARRAVVTFIGNLAPSDLGEEIDVLLSPSVLAIRGLPYNFVILVVDLSATDIAPAIRSMSKFTHGVPAAWNMSALAQQFRPIGVSKFHKVVIEDLTTLFSGSNLTTTLALGTTITR